MNFKKLALAAAIATVPAVGFSVETLEDTDLGGVTGQDGIEMAINIGVAGIATDVYVHDKDGFSAVGAGTTGYSFDGAIVIDGLAIAVGGANITVAIDAGDFAVSGGAPILNVNVTLPAALTISTGDITVANSQIDDGVTARGVEDQSGVILSSMDIVLGSTTLNIQLGNEAQTGSLAGTDMIVVNAAITGGLTVSNFALNDGSSGASIGMSPMRVEDAGAGTDLTVLADVNVTAAGIVIGLGQLGSGTGMSVEIVDQYLGTTTAGYVGDISLVGLNLNGTTITISGK